VWWGAKKRSRRWSAGREDEGTPPAPYGGASFIDTFEVREKTKLQFIITVMYKVPLNDDNSGKKYPRF